MNNIIHLIISKEGILHKIPQSKFDEVLNNNTAINDYIEKEFSIHQLDQIILRHSDGREFKPKKMNFIDFIVNDTIVYLYTREVYQVDNPLQQQHQHECLECKAEGKKGNVESPLQDILRLYPQIQEQSILSYLGNQVSSDLNNLMRLFSNTRLHFLQLNQTISRVKHQQASYSCIFLNIYSHYKFSKAKLITSLSILEDILTKIDYYLPNFDAIVDKLKKVELHGLLKEEVDRMKGLEELFEIEKVKEHKNDCYKNLEKMKEKAKKIKKNVEEYDELMMKLQKDLDLRNEEIITKINNLQSQFDDEILNKHLDEFHKLIKGAYTKQDILTFFQVQNKIIESKINKVSENAQDLMKVVDEEWMNNVKNFKRYLNDSVAIQMKINKKLENKLGLIERVNQRYQKTMHEIKSMDVFPTIYTKLIDEIDRRQVFAARLTKMLNTMEKAHQDENQTRKRFITNYGRYLPNGFCAFLLAYFPQVGCDIIKQILDKDIKSQRIKDDDDDDDMFKGQNELKEESEIKENDWFILEEEAKGNKAIDKDVQNAIYISRFEESLENQKEGVLRKTEAGFNALEEKIFNLELTIMQNKKHLGDYLRDVQSKHLKARSDLMDQIKSKNIEMHQALESKDASIERFQKEIQDLLMMNEGLTKELNKAKDAIEYMNKTIGEDKSMFKGDYTENVDEKWSLTEMKGRIERLIEDNARLKEENEWLKQENERLKEENERLKQENEKLKEGNEHLKQEDEHLKQENEHLKEGNEHLKQENEQLKQENERLEQENEQLKQENERLEQENEHLKQEDEHLKEENMRLVSRLNKVCDELRIQREEEIAERAQKEAGRIEIEHEREAYKANLESLIKEMDEGFEERDAKIREKDDIITALTTKMQRALAEKEAAILAASERMKQRNNELRGLVLEMNNAILVKNEAIGVLELELENRGKANEAMIKKLQMELKKALEEKEAIIHEKDLAMQRLISEKERIQNEKANMMRRLEQEKASTMKELELEKERFNIEKKRLNIEKESLRLEMDESLKVKDGVIQGLEVKLSKVIKEKNDAIEDLKDRDIAMRGLKIDLDKARIDIEELMESLKAKENILKKVESKNEIPRFKNQIPTNAIKPKVVYDILLQFSELAVGSLVLCLPTSSSHYYIPHNDDQEPNTIYFLGEEDRYILLAPKEDKKEVIIGRILKINQLEKREVKKALKNYEYANQNKNVKLVEIERILSVEYLC